MGQIHVVRAENRSRYEHLFDSYFRLRHDIYVKQRRWMALDRPDQREIDQFDTDAATYLFAIENDRIVGSMRAVPTTSPTLMSDIFPQLNLRGPIARPDVFELSRIFVVPERRGEHSGPRLEVVLRAAIMEYGLEIGLTGFTIVLEAWWLPKLAESGWHVTPLGIPERIDDMTVLSVFVECTEDAWRSNCLECGADSPVLEWSGLQDVSRATLPLLSLPYLAPLSD